MLQSYQKKFDEFPKKASLALEHKNRLELDDSNYLDPEGALKYQSMIGELQWLITSGRIDIYAAIMTMSLFCSLPRKGHLE